MISPRMIVSSDVINLLLKLIKLQFLHYDRPIRGKCDVGSFVSEVNVESVTGNRYPSPFKR
jgi:hypothetical protein